MNKYSELTQLVTKKFEILLSILQFIWPDFVYKHFYWGNFICNTHCHLGSGFVCPFDWKHAGTLAPFTWQKSIKTHYSIIMCFL